MHRLALAAILLSGSAANAEPATEHSVAQVEVDPLPFALGGYGVMVGIRDPAWHGLRVSTAQFSLHVPDALSQLGGNDGFDLEVRPSSGAIYVLYYGQPVGSNGLTFGGSIRHLKLRYKHDDEPGKQLTIHEISPELIVGYQWHPFKTGALKAFYAQPWLALGFVLARSDKPVVGTHANDEMPISTFFTVNFGWEMSL